MINDRAGYQSDDTVFELPVFDSHNGGCFAAERARPRPTSGTGKASVGGI